MGGWLRSKGSADLGYLTHFFAFLTKTSQMAHETPLPYRMSSFACALLGERHLLGAIFVIDR
jgi:hypothetical protein